MKVVVKEFGGKVVRKYHNVKESEAKRIEFEEQMNGYKTEIVK